jgi:hypothetical protein
VAEETETRESALGEQVPAEGAPAPRPPAPRFRPLKGFRARRAKRRAAIEARKEARTPPARSAPLPEKLDFLANRINDSQMAELVAMYSNPRRMFWINLLMGMGRGLGYGIGLGLLTGVAIYLLQKLIQANLPYLSDWLATIIHLVDQKARP